MIIFLYGPDDWRREQKKKSVIAEFGRKHYALGSDFFDFSKEGETSKFREFARGQSIFEKVRLAVLENAFVEEARDIVAAQIRPLVEDKNTNILISEKDEPPKSMSFLAKKPVLAQSFDYLRGYEWESFIKNTAKSLGITLADSALKLLAQIYENNSWGVVTELEKIGFLKRDTVEARDLERLSLEAKPGFWLLIDALKGFDFKRRFIALERILALNEPLPKIFNILASQWRERIPEMAEYDLRVKSGKLDYEEALLDLVIS